VPARLKFLKTDRAEAAAITDVLKRLAMANPGVHFVLNGTDRSPSNWPAVSGVGALQARLAQVIGNDFAQNAVQLGSSRHGVVVAGLAGLPTYTRANSLSQFYFVNGRSVRDKVLVGAIRAAYADYTFRDRFPVVALYVAIDPGRGGRQCASGQGGIAFPRCRGGAERGHPGHRRGVDGGRIQGVDERRRGCARSVHRANL
jgi:DNA mismatch repair protein MutL